MSKPDASWPEIAQVIQLGNFTYFSRLKAFWVDLMAFNDRIVIRDLGHLQTAIRNNDKAYCTSLQEKYSGFLPEDLAPWHTWEERFQRQDTFASLLMPDDIPANLNPTKVTGNGNCLFNSASINLVGNEDLSVVLRLLTAAELYLHADFYANHPR